MTSANVRQSRKLHHAPETQPSTERADLQTCPAVRSVTNVLVRVVFVVMVVMHRSSKRGSGEE
jgi:hypothetical protein